MTRIYRNRGRQFAAYSIEFPINDLKLDLERKKTCKLKN